MSAHDSTNFAVDSCSSCTELLAKNAELRDQVEIQRLAHISIAAASEMIIWFSQDGQIRFANAAACDKLGYRQEELLDLTVHDIVLDLPEKHYKNQRQELGERTSVPLNVTYCHKNGSKFQVELILNHAVFEGKGYFFAHARDRGEHVRTVKSLQEKLSFHQQTLESIPGMVFTTLPNGYCDYQSQQWEEYTGVPMSEHLGDGWNQLLHPDDQERAFAEWQAAVAGKSPYDLEYRVGRYDGLFEWFRVIGHPIKNDKGQIVRWFGVAMNIEKLKQAEKALRESELRYRTVGEAVPYGIWQADRTGYCTYVSDSFVKLTGLSLTELQKFGWLHLLPPEDRQPTKEHWLHCVQSGDNFQLEHCLQLKDGSIHHILAIGRPIYNESGQIEYWVGINLDITERKLAEEKLRASEKRWNLALENIEAGVIIANKEAEVIYWNPAARKLHGFTSPDEGFNPLDETFDLWTPDRRHKLELDERPIRRIKRGETLRGYELRLHRPDQGWEKNISYSGSMVETAEGDELIFLTLYDLTDLRESEQKLHRRTEDLAAVNRELKAFSYSVSHDLRGPLRTISGFSSLLRKHVGELDGKAKEYLQMIEAGTKKMNHIIDDLLRLSKITRQEMSWDRVDLSRMAEAVVSDICQEHPQRQVETHIAPGLTAHGDANLLRIALTNLLGNAWKYTAKTTKPRVEFSSCHKNGREAFFIRDNGAGFSMEYTERLFQPFQRLHSDSEFPGTGIGLPIAHKVISRHGGDIWAEGEPGKGAVFYFTLSS